MIKEKYVGENEMEEYITKLFNQYPLIYKIDDRFFAFGNGVCAECVNQSRSDLEYLYKQYCDNIGTEIDRETAWKIFHRLTNIGENIRQEEGICFNPKEKIKEFNFSEQEMLELKTQIDQYLTYWKNHNLADWIKNRYISK